MTATGIVVLFSFLSACSQGAHNNPVGLFSALSAFRFLLGIGIGAEYPCGSVAASEQSEEEGIDKKAQHRWFALATSKYGISNLFYRFSEFHLDTMIDWGFVIGAFVPLLLLWM